MKILIVEDDPTLSRNIREALEAEDLRAENVYDGLLAERMLQKNAYDCIIMDVNLPGKTGLELLQNLRDQDNPTPVIMLTAFGDLEDKVRGFDAGADDYLTKPFYMRELLLRVQSLLKRNTPGGEKKSSIQVDDIRIDTGRKKVERQGREIPLTPREYQILVKLCETPGELVSKNDLIREIWGTALDVNTNTIEVYINFLRNKLDKPFEKSSIKTKVGYGYYFDAE
ncbi:response regulator transcription factor [Leadbetterella sp. DM7]|uniref:response regulator transcription factor n=1 Tax=Leadbetterella sp. DM7 TaxID=3235085 RepID=UPI00349EB305